MSKTIMILQAFGLGDCIWSQSIAHCFIEQGYHVVWPVKKHYVDGLNRAYPEISFMPDTSIKPEIFDIKEKIEYDGMLISPIRWSNHYMKVPYKFVMRAKYDMYELDWKTWKNHAAWKIDDERCVSLKDILGIKNGELYNLINKRFGTNAELSVEINVNNGFRNIEMTDIPGYSLFDWTLVILSATEIHSVSSAILYIFEMLPLAQPIHLYCRKPIEPDFEYVKFMFTKDYILYQ